MVGDEATIVSDHVRVEKPGRNGGSSQEGGGRKYQVRLVMRDLWITGPNSDKG